MKLIFDNKYIKSYQFKNENEFERFVDNQDVQKKLIIEKDGNDFFYCYVGYNSLNSEKLFVITFDSYKAKEELAFLYWTKTNLVVLDNGNEIFLVDDSMQIINSYKIITPLIGLFITESNNLLILEEAAMKLVLPDGKLLKDEQFDLLDDYFIQNDILHLEYNSVKKKIIL